MDILLSEIIDLAYKVTGKTVIIHANNTTAHQCLKHIYVGNSLPVYNISHEILHWVMATKEERLLPNLVFGFEYDYGHERPEDEVLLYQLFQEQCVGYIQKRIFLDCDFYRYALECEDIFRISRYLDHIYFVDEDEEKKYRDYQIFTKIHEYALSQLKDITDSKRINIFDEFKRLSELVKTNYKIVNA